MQIGREQSRRNWEAYLDEQTYEQLRRKATAIINRESLALSTRGDDLLQETLLRLIQSDEKFTCNSSNHFRATVALRMSHVLLDIVRASKAAKRGRGCSHIPLDEKAQHEFASAPQQAIIRQALDRLGLYQARLRRALELRMAGEASLSEIAGELSVSVRTVKRDLAKANKWMRQELNFETTTNRLRSGRRCQRV